MESREDKIRGFAKSSNHIGAVRGIESLGNEIYKECDLVEAKIRILARKLPPLEMAPEPKWLSLSMDKIRRNTPGLDDKVIQSASHLVRSALHIHPDAEEDVCFSLFDHSSFTVEWNNSVRLLWHISPFPISWPGILVRTFRAKSPEEPSLQNRVFWTAHTVLEHFREAYGVADADQILG